MGAGSIAVLASISGTIAMLVIAASFASVDEPAVCRGTTPELCQFVNSIQTTSLLSTLFSSLPNVFLLFFACCLAADNEMGGREFQGDNLSGQHFFAGSYLLLEAVAAGTGIANNVKLWQNPNYTKMLDLQNHTAFYEKTVTESALTATISHSISLLAAGISLTLYCRGGHSENGMK